MGKEKKFCEVCLTETNTVSQKDLNEKEKESKQVIAVKPSSNSNSSLAAFALGLSLITFFAMLMMLGSTHKRFMDNERAIVYLANNTQPPAQTQQLADPSTFTDPTQDPNGCMGLNFNSNYPDAGVCTLTNSQNGTNYISPIPTTVTPSCTVAQSQGNQMRSGIGTMMSGTRNTATQNSSASAYSDAMQRFHKTLTPEQLASMGMSPNVNSCNP